MRSIAALLFVSCVHAAPPAPAPAPVPEAVSLTVRAAGPLEGLVDETQAHARARLERQRHPVVEAAPVAIEMEIASVGGVVKNGTYEYCVKLIGRVVRDGQPAADAVKEKCDVVRFTNGTRSADAAAFTWALAVTTAVTLSKTAPSAQSQLYVAALDELVDALGRQAVRSN